MNAPMTRLNRWRASTALAFVVPALVVGTALALLAAQPRPVAADASPSPTSSSSPAAVSGDPAHGQQVYNANCASCHGANLEGGIGPKLNPIQPLAGVPNPKDPGFLIATIANGRKGQPDGFSADMPAWAGKLTPKDIQDVVAFIIAAQATKASVDPRTLAISNVEWVTIGILVMVFLTWLLARYNMRWIDRRIAARRARLGPGGTGRHP